MSSLLEAIKNKRQAIAAKSGRERPTKLSSAKNLIRVLPRWDGDLEGTFFQDFGQHFIKDKDGKILAVYICTATTFNKECEVCASIASHSASNHDEDMVKILQEARSSSRILVNAIYMNGTHANAKTDPVLLELPVSVLNDILGIMETYLEDHSINLIDPEKGYDLVITKSGTGRDTKYNVTPSPVARAIPNVKDVMAKCRNLDEYAQQEYQEGLQKAITSLNAVAGHLSGPSAAGSTARLVGPSSEAKSAASTQAEKLASTTPVDMDDLELLEAEVSTPAPTAAKPAPAVTQVAPAASNIDSELDELDALLAEANAA